MTLYELFDKLDLKVLCNGCSQPMRYMGEWPVKYPPTEPTDACGNVQQAVRWVCETCRTPHPTYAKGLPVLVSMIVTVSELRENLE